MRGVVKSSQMPDKGWTEYPLWLLTLTLWATILAPPLSLSYWVTLSWLLPVSEPQFPKDDRTRLDDHHGSSPEHSPMCPFSVFTPTPIHSGPRPSSWRSHENLVSALAENPPHIHPFQLKHPGWPLDWKSLCSSWTGVIFFGVSLDGPRPGQLPILLSPYKVHHHPGKSQETVQRSKDTSAASSRPVSCGLPTRWHPTWWSSEALGARHRGMGLLGLANILNIVN